MAFAQLGFAARVAATVTLVVEPHWPEFMQALAEVARDGGIGFGDAAPQGVAKRAVVQLLGFGQGREGTATLLEGSNHVGGMGILEGHSVTIVNQQVTFVTRNGN